MKSHKRRFKRLKNFVETQDTAELESRDIDDVLPMINTTFVSSLSKSKAGEEKVSFREMEYNGSRFTLLQSGRAARRERFIEKQRSRAAKRREKRKVVASRKQDDHTIKKEHVPDVKSDHSVSITSSSKEVFDTCGTRDTLDLPSSKKKKRKLNP